MNNGSRVEVDIFDVLGDKKATLANGIYNRGVERFIWDIDEYSKERVYHGLYFAVIKIGDVKPVIKKIMVVNCK